MMNAERFTGSTTKMCDGATATPPAAPTTAPATGPTTTPDIDDINKQFEFAHFSDPHFGSKTPKAVTESVEVSHV